MLPGVSVPGVVSRGEGDHHEEGNDAAVGFHNGTTSRTKYCILVAALINMKIVFLRKRRVNNSTGMFLIKQCCGAGAGSVGSVCFLSSRIRILLSSSKNSKKNLNSYCFVTSL